MSKGSPCKRCGGVKVDAGRGARYCLPCQEVARSGDHRRELDRALHQKRRDEAIAAGTYARRRKVQEGQKWCARCQRSLPVASFASSGDKLAAYCIPCQRDYNHSRTLERQYNITAERYSELLQMQDGRCAICLTRPRTRRLAVDHDHETGEVRGLLCTRCNHGILGKAHDSAAILRRALTYLIRPPAKTGEAPAEDADAAADIEFIEEQCKFLLDGGIARHATRNVVAVTPATFLALAQAAGRALIVEDCIHNPPADMAIDDLLLAQQTHRNAMDGETFVDLLNSAGYR